MIVNQQKYDELNRRFREANLTTRVYFPMTTTSRTSMNKYASRT